MQTNGDAPTTMKALNDAAVMTFVRLSRRSWWIALYRNGRQRAEYETLVDTILTPLGRGRTSRWEEISKNGMISLRLLCPNGQIGELWGEPHHFFQLKCAVQGIGQGRSHVRAHLIGVVDTDDGGCQCWVWEPQTGQLRSFRDNISAMAYQGIGRLSHEVQGLRV